MSNPLRPGQMTPAERLEDASKLLLNGFQAASFRIPAEDFHDVVISAKSIDPLLVVDAYSTFHDDSGRSSYFARDHFYLR